VGLFFFALHAIRSFWNSRSAAKQILLDGVVSTTHIDLAADKKQLGGAR
jgi:hypothetical protein